MPDKRRLVTSKVCFGSEKSGLLDHSYNKCALDSKCFFQLQFYNSGTYLFFVALFEKPDPFKMNPFSSC